METPTARLRTLKTVSWLGISCGGYNKWRNRRGLADLRDGPPTKRKGPMIETPPTPSAPLAPQRSADGLWEWNGTQWIAAQPPPGAQQVAQSTPVAQAAPPAHANP